MRGGAAPGLSVVVSLVCAIFYAGVPLPARGQGADPQDSLMTLDDYFDATPTPSPGPSPLPTPVVSESSALRCSGDSVRYLSDGKVIVAEGSIFLAYKDIEITADRITVYVDRKEAYAQGGVTLKRGDDFIRAEALRYDFVREEGMVGESTGYFKPMFGQARRIITTDNDQADLQQGTVTTDDYTRPDYYMEASEVTVYFNDYVSIWSPVVYVGGVPVFWLPYFYRSLKMDCRGSFLYPGYKNTWGMYVLSGYNWCTEGLNLTGHLDYRYLRGVALGLDGLFVPWESGQGEWQTYYLQDLAYEDPDTGEKEHKERYLAEFWGRQDLFWDVYGDLSLHYLSDDDIRREFFRNEYRADSQPKSYLFFGKNTTDLAISLEIRPRLNDFWEVNEKLPEAKFQIKEIALGESDFYYQGDNSYVVYRHMEAGEGSPAYETDRADTYHRLSYTRKFFGWLNLNPYVSLRGTYYTKGPPDEAASASPAATPTPEPEERTDFGRLVYGSGIGVSTNIYGLFDYTNEALDIHRLRHVIEPSITYVYANPTVESDDLYQFDDLDDIDWTSAFQLSLRNQLQTKRYASGTEDSWTLIDLILGTSLYTSPDRENAGDLFSDLYADLKLTPVAGTGLEGELYYDPYRGAVNRFTLDIWGTGGESWRGDLEYTYRADKDRNRLGASLYLRINPLWRFSVYGRYDLEAGEWEEESIELFRDLHSWDCSLLLRRDEGGEATEIGLRFWLKAFPDAPLHISN
ncbi:MAG TPA: LPS assembly protein LptD [bacterium]|mgnify:CR=1 FL=1|nr:LPS assembly protein LptD [bacterium]HPJ71565.1 LPS assembly protein LptD [bacterium]HPQ66701.1 LPS assembly protein LptD [bacterium]